MRIFLKSMLVISKKYWLLLDNTDNPHQPQKILSRKNYNVNEKPKTKQNFSMNYFANGMANRILG